MAKKKKDTSQGKTTAELFSDFNKKNRESRKKMRAADAEYNIKRRKKLLEDLDKM